MKLPKNWNDVTLEQYVELLPSAFEKFDYIKLPAHKELKKSMYTLSILSGKSIEDIKQLPKDFIEKRCGELSFLNELPAEHYKATFKLNGVRYKVEPNANKMSAGSYITTMHLFQDLKKDPEKIEKNLHIILAQVVQPIKRKGFKWVNYDIDRIKIAEDFYNDLSMEIAYPICVFFCNLSKDLTRIIDVYSMQTLTKQMTELRIIQKDLGSGDGS